MAPYKYAPKKKVYRKKYKRRYNKRKQLAKISCSSERLTYMVANQLPFPPRYRTKMTFAIYGAIAAGGLDALGEGEAYVNLNSPFKPINNGSWGLGGSGPFSVANPVAVSALMPAAYTQICNQNLYQKFRVYSSSIKVSVNPGDVRDYLELCVIPTDDTGIPTIVSTAQSLPFAKCKQILTGKGPSHVTNSITLHKLAGVTKSAVENDLSNQFIGDFNADPATRYYWRILVGTNQQTDNFVGMAFEMKVTYWVEFFNLANARFAIS